MKVAVIDYGMGNLRSVAKAIEHVGGADVSVDVTSDPKVVLGAARVVFPGQGAARQPAYAMPTDLRQALQMATGGEYEIHHELGRGGMGSVFLARVEDPLSINENEIAAVRWIDAKQLSEELAETPDSFTPWLASRTWLAVQS